MESEVMTGVDHCKQLLRDARSYNQTHEIFASENAIIDRLLARDLELGDAYLELHAKLSPRPNALSEFLRVVTVTGALWTPDSIREVRSAKTRLGEINRQIAEHAAKLASLIDERSELHDSSGFSTRTHYHVCKIIDDAAQHNHLFKFWVQEELRSLRGRFDLKYWPSLAEYMAAVGRDAADAGLEPYDSIAAAASEVRRASQVDFFRALFAAIEESSTAHGGFIPAHVKISDASLASLANCVLDLGGDDLIDAAYVKRLRQRERQRAALPTERRSGG